MLPAAIGGTLPFVTIESRRRQWLPPSPEQQAAAKASTAAFRAEVEERRAAALPLRKAMFASLIERGVRLRDEEAALACFCGCHPQLDLGAHGDRGQAGCSCQLTPDERLAATRQLFEVLPETDPQRAALHAQEQEALAARATELQAEVRIAASLVPFVLVGMVDGRGFYLRERHDLWRVTVAPDEDPGIDPWAADPSVPVLDIADGDADGLFAEGTPRAVRALEVAVAAVRSYLRQRECTHRRSLPSDRFCRACGTALVAPELP